MDTLEAGEVNAIPHTPIHRNDLHENKATSGLRSTTAADAERITQYRPSEDGKSEIDTASADNSARDVEKGYPSNSPENNSALDPECRTSTFAANSANATDDNTVAPLRGLSFLDRFLVIWIILAMAIGIILGNEVPSSGPRLQKADFVGVSVPIAVGLLVMMYPILCKVRYESLHLLLRSRALWIQLLISVVLNWVICPLLMTGLAWAFLPDRQDLRQGLIFVGLARCIAMVLIWTELAKGDTDYCAVLVAVNSILQMILFAPLAVFYINIVSDYDDTGGFQYAIVARSVGVFLGIPLGAAVITRLSLRPLLGPSKYQTHFIRYLAPWSLIGLLYTIIVLFASQGAHVVHQITSVLRVCAPLVVYFLITFTGTVLLCWKLGFGYKTSCTQSFTAASNNFELAIAVVVAVYGASSGEALASTVGPLIEVPVLVALVYVLQYVRKRTGWKD